MPGPGQYWDGADSAIAVLGRCWHKVAYPLGHRIYIYFTDMSAGMPGFAVFALVIPGGCASMCQCVP